MVFSVTDATGAGSPPVMVTWTITPSGGGDTVSVLNPGDQNGILGTSAHLLIQATDTAAGQTLSYSATGLPYGSHRHGDQHRGAVIGAAIASPTA